MAEKYDVAGPQTRFIPIPKWPNYHPWPSVAGLRWMVFNKKKNGFAQAFPKIGGRILVDDGGLSPRLWLRNSELRQCAEVFIGDLANLETVDRSLASQIETLMKNSGERFQYRRERDRTSRA